MSDIISNYPWMIGIVVIGSFLFILIVVKVSKSSKSNSVDDASNVSDNNENTKVVEAQILPLRSEVVATEEQDVVQTEEQEVQDEVQTEEQKEQDEVQTEEQEEQVVVQVEEQEAQDVEQTEEQDVVQDEVQTEEQKEQDEVQTEEQEEQVVVNAEKKVVKTTKKATTKKTEKVSEPKAKETSATKNSVKKTDESKTVKPKTSKKEEQKMSTKTEVKVKRAPKGKYELFEVEGTDSFKYILKASNGEKLIESDLFASKENVKQAIEAIKRNLETGKTNIHKDKNGMFQFKLVASNNRPIAISANYVSKQNAEKALESFKRFAVDSEIKEIEEPKDSLIEEIDVTREKLDVQGKIIISNDSASWIFKLFANNGELLCTSKPYSSKANCDEGVETFRTNVVEGKFLVIRDKNKLYQFKLQTQSKRLIVIGQTYEDKQRAISSAQSVASFSDDSKVIYE